MPKTIFLVVFVFVFCLSAISMTPMTFAAPRSNSPGASYEAAYGTIWQGGLSGVQIIGEDVGDVRLQARWSDLASGRLGYDAAFQGTVGAGRGKVSIDARRRLDVSDAIADIYLHAMQGLDVRLRTANSKLSIALDTMSFDADHACLEATGRLSSDILVAVGQRWDWAGPRMLGDISCDNGEISVQLRNDGGPDQITANGRVSTGGAFDVSARVETEDPRLAAALDTLGFRFLDGAYSYEMSTMNGGVGGR